MSKNRLSDLVDHLFVQLEILRDEELEGDALKQAIGRAGAVSQLAGNVIASGELALKASKLQSEHGPLSAVPKLLGLDTGA